MFSRASFQEYHQSAKQFGTRSDSTRHFGPDQGPDAFQRLSANKEGLTHGLGNPLMYDKCYLLKTKHYQQDGLLSSST